VRSPAGGWLELVSSCPTFAPGSHNWQFLHVSAPLRATGIGSRLSEQLEQIARAAGDSDMVVSATPSENTVRFYLGRGFQPMAHPLAELFELEPEDVHMHKML
jgi:GNAT superfamily N-acetyltransferase